ncbi:MAG: glycosyltransferase family protein [Algoriphagus sp.]|uniref:glycosyltransferase family protein n=1 Tax=Algoriphagus sp. TaxID=1872435 RepID=UPI002730A8F6|nr:glycosyltransferase family protein [Algoriphagus sp.]MDP2043388.1 glycosyltransferase family protein [Algoriphagus sp.]MDP3471679.1 glycosyltransferase family protein [Algoriphagus sp.]
MNFLFIVQGEGRGHMTQAIAFDKLLETNGHRLVGVILGKSKRRAVPEFFEREISAPIYLIDSPNFETDGNQKKVSIRKTILKNSLKLKTFHKSLRAIDQIVEAKNPDVILNFYDLLGGLYNFIYRPKAKFWVIGHQYLIDHPSFQFAPNRPFDKFLFRLNTALTSLGADERLALSFLPQIRYANQNLRVVPPLLRPEVKLLDSKQGDFYLAYMVNPGYAEEVIYFAEANPHLQIKAYWDKKEAAETEFPLSNLSFHRVHDKNFLQDMANCKGLVCTAGFESVCEAKYLGKPVMMIPVAGQYEQACNALDAEASGVGITSENFDFAKLESLQKKDAEASLLYKNWVDFWPMVFREMSLEAFAQEQEGQSIFPQESIPALG